MDGVATPIIGRPRPLPGHDTPNPAYHPHTLNYEEPDIVLPDLKVIIEPDGRKKFGDTEQEVRENTGKWLARQHDLTNAGWRVIRVRWHDTEDLVAFRTNIAVQIQIEHLPLTQQSLRLWAEPRQQHVPRKQRTRK